MAGVMGGARTACTADTVDVLFEAAFFAPAAIAGRGRRYGLVTDAGQRFERGVDPAHQERAMERATQLLIEDRGRPGRSRAGRRRTRTALPRRLEVALRRERIGRLLGTQIADNEVKATLESLGMRVLANERLARDAALASLRHRHRGRSHRRAGAHRRIRSDHRSGRHRAPESAPAPRTGAGRDRRRSRSWRARGYQEAITYAFVDPALQDKLFPGVVTPVLSNPISSDMAVMRASLWPGLIKAALENQRRQQDRIRLFEHGARFEIGGIETDLIAGIAIGLAAAGAVGREVQRRWTSST